jgi:hypothetical protein
MLSTRLQQVTQLHLDRAAAQGLVNKSEVAEMVYTIVRDNPEFWSIQDKRAALQAYIRDGIDALMSERMSEDYLRMHMAHVPRRHLYLLEKRPQYICINAAAGLHILSVKATREHWAASVKIKRTIGNSVIEKADDDEDVMRLLVAEGVDTLEELGRREMAA